MTAADRARWRTEHARARHALRARLHETFASLIRVTEEPDEFLRFAPAPGAWSGLSVLEHVTLTDRDLREALDPARLVSGAVPEGA